MNGQTSVRTSTYKETIAKLKNEINDEFSILKAGDSWDRIERAYRALAAIEDLAGVKRSSLEELFGLTIVSALPVAPIGPANASSLELGDQQESEAAAEIEKGS